MITLTIGEATGRKVDRGKGSYIFLERYDPFLKTWSGSGYDAELRDPILGMIRNSDLLELGIEITPSEDELKNIEALRLTNRVYKAAKELGEALEEWLHNPLAR